MALITLGGRLLSSAAGGSRLMPATTTASRIRTSPLTAMTSEIRAVSISSQLPC